MNNEERERFFSRLATVPGIHTMPSIGAWILVEVDNPNDLARRINRRTVPGMVSVPRHVPHAVRIPVRDPKSNETLFMVIREIMVREARQRFYRELRQASVVAN